MRRRERAPSRGFSLVELMIAVAIIGVLATLAIYGIRRYIAAAIAAEAKDGVGAISRGAVTAFEKGTTSAKLLGAGTESGGGETHSLCDSAAPVPATLAPVKGTKYQPDNTAGKDFNSGGATEGWLCLAFTRTQPIHYRYTYFKESGYVSSSLSGAPDPGANGFEAGAQGDLDADGALSTFTRVGTIVNGEVTLATTVYVNQEFE